VVGIVSGELGSENTGDEAVDADEALGGADGEGGLSEADGGEVEGDVVFLAHDTFRRVNANRWD
jgi:hypothetical protein